MRIDAGGAGEAGDPAWGADSVAAPSSLGNARIVGADQVATTTGPIDVSDRSIPAGVPPAVFRPSGSTSGWGRRTSPTSCRGPAWEVRGPGVLRRGLCGLHRGHQPGAGRLGRTAPWWTTTSTSWAGPAAPTRPSRGPTRSPPPPTNRRSRSTSAGSGRPPAIAALELLAAPCPSRSTVRGRGPIRSPAAAGSARTACRQLDGYFYRAGGQISSSTTRSSRPPSTIDTTLAPVSGPRSPPSPRPSTTCRPSRAEGRLWYIGGITGGPGTGRPRGPSGQVAATTRPPASWPAHAPMPRPRGRAGSPWSTAASTTSVGSVSPTETSAQVDVYDIATDTWSELPDLPVAKDHFKAAVIGTDIHLPGGRPAPPRRR